MEVYPRSEAENIFYTVLHWLEKKSKTDVIVGTETLLKETYIDILSELRNYTPVQYLTNEAPFYSLDLFVDESVLIPRPETEQLVHWVIEENQEFDGSIADVGTGSGCIALALKKFLPHSTVVGYDVSSEALTIARKNARDLILDVSFINTDILKSTISEVDIIVSNPPYIAHSEKESMNQNVLSHEPHLALFVEDTDPLIFYKRIINLAQEMNATCYFETSEFYRKELDTWLEDNQLTYTWKKDFQGKDRLLRIELV